MFTRIKSLQPLELSARHIRLLTLMLILALVIPLAPAGSLRANAEEIAAPTFTDIALTAGIQDRYTRMRGAAPADFDLDGDMDVFLGSTGDTSRFFWYPGAHPII